MRQKLFLAHSFAQEHLNAEGQYDPTMMSDIEMADLVTQWIKEFNSDIEVVRTADPFHGYIPPTIARDMAGCDYVLCMFSGRTRDGLLRKWIPSTYVVSESGLAFGLMPNEEERLRRLHCFVEDRVDREQLGLAFHSSQTKHEFSRNDKEGLRKKVGELVRHISNGNSLPVPERECLTLEKNVWIWRNGAVVVETRHKFRFREPRQSIRIPHTMWRISDTLPALTELLDREKKDVPGFLRCTLVDLGHAGQRSGKCRIDPGNTSDDGREHGFFVDISNVDVKAGDEVSYSIGWGYRTAFGNSATDDIPNSVGIRTGSRGIARRASLTLHFERDTEEYDRIVEQPPSISTNSDTSIPNSDKRCNYWHDQSRWESFGTLDRCTQASGAVFDAYRWMAESFVGTAKVTWNAHLNYFQSDAGMGRRLAVPRFVEEAKGEDMTPRDS